MKSVRVWAAALLILAAILLIPVSLSLGEQKLTYAQRKAIANCKTKQTACVVACSLQYGPKDGANRLSRIACDDSCKETYLTCVFSVRRSATTIEPGQAQQPQVAPPKPTPRKISPQAVGAVSTEKAPATPSPTRSPLKVLPGSTDKAGALPPP